ncbi:caspase family protein [Aequorivita capsosiphonis]|uniref:caspase family protein n=1 Tax=Aequorivita capsosiphonis TaxID=487317 RepID=UPI0004198986|nr:caspase family protein [Aequorivita capsosiphonis]
MKTLIKIIRSSIVLLIALSFSMGFSQIDRNKFKTKKYNNGDVNKTEKVIAKKGQQDSTKLMVLLIGNASYQGFNALNTPIKDINLIGKNLSNLGFNVTKVENATKIEMQSAIRRFILTSKEAKISFFYYAGHTVQINGKNYLVPIDAKLEDENAIALETLNLDFYLENVDTTKQNLISIDGCYANNFPFKTREENDEPCFMNPTDMPEHTFISFRSAKRLIGLGTDEKNSLFADTFSERLQPYSSVKNTYLGTKIAMKEISGGKADITVFGDLTEGLTWVGKVEPNLNIVKRLNFPWPPPTPSRMVDQDVFATAFENCETLQDVNNLLVSALRKHGYSEIRYYGISKDGLNHGYAIATQLEQINVDATSKKHPYRWKEELLKDTEADTENFFIRILKSVFMPNEGYFRVFVFSVTDIGLDQDFEAKVSRQEALSWVAGPSNPLPPEIKIKDASNYQVRAFIYEYKLSQNTISAELELPSSNTGIKHIEQSKLGQELIKD